VMVAPPRKISRMKLTRQIVWMTVRKCIRR
jgi:hypothetical protein